jgi:hypothetical protein
LNFFLNFEKIWPYHEREMEKMKKNQFWNLNSNFKKIWPYHHREMKNLKYATKILNEKIWKFSFLKIEMKKPYILFMPPR